MNSLLIVVQVFQSVALIVIAGVGAEIAWQQMQTARVKLQHDLYDRRYAVYQAARVLLKEVSDRGDASNEGMFAFLLGTADAPFLFDDDMAAYLVVLHVQASQLHAINAPIESMAPGENKNAAVHKSGELRSAFLAQREALQKKFLPYLQLHRRRRSMWYLPWR
jgi:hypothetical protein